MVDIVLNPEREMGGKQEASAICVLVVCSQKVMQGELLPNLHNFFCSFVVTTADSISENGQFSNIMI